MSFSCYTLKQNMTRKKHMAAIRFIAQQEGVDSAMRYWLNNCPRISKKAFNDAIS